MFYGDPGKRPELRAQLLELALGDIVWKTAEPDFDDAVALLELDITCFTSAATFSRRRSSVAVRLAFPTSGTPSITAVPPTITMAITHG
mmetsp:Transcript_96438/g.278372  ORF Transcript_96438/g.278372 Transcript_96438/m.278372 type:complete len:89 (+) Transcript_96438:299-565(+)